MVDGVKDGENVYRNPRAIVAEARKEPPFEKQLEDDKAFEAIKLEKQLGENHEAELEQLKAAFDQEKEKLRSDIVTEEAAKLQEAMAAAAKEREEAVARVYQEVGTKMEKAETSLIQ